MVVELRTLPQVALDAALGLDQLREFLRRRGDLAALATTFGGARVFSVEATTRIIEEFRASRRDRRKRALPSVG